MASTTHVALITILHNFHGPWLLFTFTLGITIGFTNLQSGNSWIVSVPYCIVSSFKHDAGNMAAAAAGLNRPTSTHGHEHIWLGASPVPTPCMWHDQLHVSFAAYSIVLRMIHGV